MIRIRFKGPGANNEALTKPLSLNALQGSYFEALLHFRGLSDDAADVTIETEGVYEPAVAAYLVEGVHDRHCKAALTPDLYQFFQLPPPAQPPTPYCARARAEGVLKRAMQRWNFGRLRRRRRLLWSRSEVNVTSGDQYEYTLKVTDLLLRVAWDTQLDGDDDLPTLCVGTEEVLLKFEGILRVSLPCGLVKGAVTLRFPTARERYISVCSLALPGPVARNLSENIESWRSGGFVCEPMRHQMVEVCREMYPRFVGPDFKECTGRPSCLICKDLRVTPLRRYHPELIDCWPNWRSELWRRYRSDVLQWLESQWS